MTGRDVLLAALIGSPPATSADDRVRYDAADESDTFPFIVVRRAEVDRQTNLDGAVLATRERFVVECWGETRAASDDLEAEAAAALVAAGLPPDQPNEADGIDPELKVRAGVLVVDVWTQP